MRYIVPFFGHFLNFFRNEKRPFLGSIETKKRPFGGRSTSCGTQSDVITFQRFCQGCRTKSASRASFAVLPVQIDAPELPLVLPAREGERVRRDAASRTEFLAKLPFHA